MTIEQRLEQVEQQNQRIQRTNKRLTVALTMPVVAMAAVVTMAATIRDVSNREIGRWEFYENKKSGDHALLDSATGDLWRINKTTKKPVTLKK